MEDREPMPHFGNRRHICDRDAILADLQHGIHTLREGLHAGPLTQSSGCLFHHACTLSNAPYHILLHAAANRSVESSWDRQALEDEGGARLNKVHSALLCLLPQRGVAAILLRGPLQLHSAQRGLAILPCISPRISAPCTPLALQGGCQAEAGQRQV